MVVIQLWIILNSVPRNFLFFKNAIKQMSPIYGLIILLMRFKFLRSITIVTILLSENIFIYLLLSNS